jgi:glycosyltransferase involved in cell wall biosynthesis
MENSPDKSFVDESLRICLLTLQFAPIVGGVERLTELQAHQLQASGHQVMIVTLKHQREWRPCDVPDDLAVIWVGGVYRRNGQLRIGRLGIWPVMLLVGCALWRLRARYDVIHVMQVSPLSAVAALVGRIARKPVLQCLQSLDASPELVEARLTEAGLPNDRTVRRSRRDERSGFDGLRRSLIGGRLIVWYLRRAQVVFQALSLRGAAYLAAQRLPRERVIHLASGVDTVRFHPAPPVPAAASGESQNIVCVARLEFAKGVDVLLRAWAQLQHLAASDAITENMSARPRLLLVGEGRLRPHLEELARQLGIQEGVVFAGVRADIPQILRHCYCFVLPSRWEGLPNALLEAMACGLPCVATRVSGSEDVIEDGVNGLLVPPEQPEALCEALRRMLRNPEEAARLGRAAQATVEQNYSLPAVTDRCVALYRRLTSAARPTQRLTPVRGGSQ